MTFIVTHLLMICQSNLEGTFTAGDVWKVPDLAVSERQMS